MKQTDVGNRIANRRKEKGLTQLQLAERLNVSNRTVSKWENGDGYPDITILPNLSDILEISIDELIRGEKAYENPGKKQADTDEYSDNSTATKVTVLNVVSFGLVIFASVSGIITELVFYRYLVFGYIIERYIVIAIAMILAAGIIMYCCYNVKYRKSTSLFEWSNYWMTVLAFSFPVFLFFRCSHWFNNVPEGIGFFVFYSYIIAVVSLFIILKKKHKSKTEKF